MKHIHELYMQRAIDLAYLGGKEVKTNPNVGCVIVYENRIIGEGYHQRYGGPHAEVNAVNSVAPQDMQYLPKSQMYVSLEPCCIQGKTPPCTNLILNSKIPQIFISTMDPNPLVAGNGAKILRENGVKVETGVLEKEGQEVIIPFLAHLEGRPFVSLKWAMSKDNYIGSDSKRLVISNNLSNIYTHDLRSNCDGILVGTSTALKDDPSLTTRLVEGSNPIRIVLDRSLNLPHDLKLFSDGLPTLVLNETKQEQFGNIHFVKVQDLSDLDQILDVLFKRGVFRLLVEGGAKVLNSFIKSNRWDKAHIIQSDKNVDKNNKPENFVNAPNLEGKLVNLLSLDSDIIRVAYRETQKQL